MRFLDKLFGRKPKQEEQKIRYAYSSKCKNRDCENARRKGSGFCQECSDKYHRAEPISNAKYFLEKNEHASLSK